MGVVAEDLHESPFLFQKNRLDTEEDLEIPGECTLSVFIQENLKRVFHVISCIVGSTADAQDLTQETMIKVLQRRTQLRDTEKRIAWILRIARNTAIDHIRRKKKDSWCDLECSSELAYRRDPEQDFLESEQKCLVKASLGLLSIRERTAIVLRDLEELHPKEVARMMGCDMATVRAHIANGRKKIRQSYGSVVGV